MPKKSTKLKKKNISKSKRNNFSKRLRKHPLLLLILLTGLAGFLPYSHSAITDQVRQRVEEVSNGACKIEKATFTPFRGVAVKGATFTRGIDAQTHMKIDMANVMIRYRPIRMLINRKKALDHLEHLIKSGKYAYIDSLFADGIAGIRTKDARFAILRSRGESTIAEGVHAKLAVEEVEGRKIGGWIAFDRLKKGAFEATDVKTNVSIQGGRIKADGLKGKCYRGRLGGAITLDGGTKRVLGGTISLRDLSLADLYADYPGKVGTLRGKVDIRMKLQKSPWEPDHLGGKGDLYAKDLYADRIPLLNTIVTTLTLPQLKSLRFRKLTADVTLNGKTISISNLQGNGTPLNILGSGGIDQHSEMDLKVEGFFPESFRDSLSPLAWNALFPDEKRKGRMFTCRVQGTYDKPWITVDRKHTRRAVKNVFSSIGRSIGSVFKRDDKKEN